MREVSAGEDAQAQPMHLDCIGHKEGGAVDTENELTSKEAGLPSDDRSLLACQAQMVKWSGYVNVKW